MHDFTGLSTPATKAFISNIDSLVILVDQVTMPWLHTLGSSLRKTLAYIVEYVSLNSRKHNLLLYDFELCNLALIRTS